VFDKAGNLYGTTNAGPSNGYGAVYELSPDGKGNWNLTVLHQFTGGSDGAGPGSGLVFDKSGNLYGTTTVGGSSNNGTVYELMLSQKGKWKEKILHSFTGGDGSAPLGVPVFDQAGDLYGTTEAGGANGDGTVYQLAPGSKGRRRLTVLRNFEGLSKRSTSTLVFDKNGVLYGTTETGGSSGCNGSGCRLVFKLTPAANGTWTYLVVHIFHQNGKDGNQPDAGVIVDSAGNLYGTTTEGGTGIWNVGCGTVFEITP